MEKNTEEAKNKKSSKLSKMIESTNEEFNGLQIFVYYSENNWETCEEIELIIDDNMTINQLIDSAIYKFKNELSYDNIDTKQFNVMLFKKKKKIPNYEYPICNLESKVKDYGKSFFCLVEDSKSEVNLKKEKEKEKGKNKNEKKNKNKDEPKNEEDNNKYNDMYETDNAKSCIIN